MKIDKVTHIMMIKDRLNIEECGVKVIRMNTVNQINTTENNE